MPIDRVALAQLSSQDLNFRRRRRWKAAQVAEAQAAGKSLFDLLEAEYQKVIDDYKAKVVDGLTFQEMLELLTLATASFLDLSRYLAEADRDTLRGAVIQAATKFYNEVLAPIDIPSIPNWLENRIVDPLIGQAVPLLVASLVDALLKILPETTDHLGGPQDHPEPAEEPTDPVTTPAGWVPY